MEVKIPRLLVVVYIKVLYIRIDVKSMFVQVLH